MALGSPQEDLDMSITPSCNQVFFAHLKKCRIINLISKILISDNATVVMTSYKKEKSTPEVCG